MLKIRHKLLSSLIISAPLLLNAGVVTTVHANSVKSNNCVTINGAKYDCSKLIQSICTGINGSVYNCTK